MEKRGVNCEFKENGHMESASSVMLREKHSWFHWWA